MKFIFPQNYNFKNKLFGVIEYSTIFLNLIWDLFVFIFINLFKNLNVKIFLFFILCKRLQIWGRRIPNSFVKCRKAHNIKDMTPAILI